jgi:hypothetical protein
MNKVAEHLAQALCSLSKVDKEEVIRYVLQDPDVKEVLVALFIDSLGKPHSELKINAFPITENALTSGITSNKELGMRARENYVAHLQQYGIRIDQIDKVWAKTSTNSWVAIPFATERRANRWFLGLPEKEVIERVRNGELAIILLCQSVSGSLLDFVLPPSKVQEIATQLSKSQGQLKFNLKKLGNRYHLVIPNHSTVDVSDYKSKVSILN